mgnify:FL=1
MPSQSRPSKETSVTGLSDELVAVVKEYASQCGEPMREVYDQAIDEMVSRIRSGDEVVFLATAPGLPWKARHIRLSYDVFDRWVDASAEQRVHKSVFFLKAVRDYLASKGVEVPD